MTQQYGNSSGALNKLQSHLGAVSLPKPNGKYIDENNDCITCKVHENNVLPLNSLGKVSDLCIQVCKPILKKMNSIDLSTYTRPQLMVKYPTLGLNVHMSKDEMLHVIKIHLLEFYLFGDSK